MLSIASRTRNITSTKVKHKATLAKQQRHIGVQQPKHTNLRKASILLLMPQIHNQAIYHCPTSTNPLKHAFQNQCTFLSKYMPHLKSLYAHLEWSLFAKPSSSQHKTTAQSSTLGMATLRQTKSKTTTHTPNTKTYHVTVATSDRPANKQPLKCTALPWMSHPV